MSITVQLSVTRACGYCGGAGFLEDPDGEYCPICDGLGDIEHTLDIEGDYLAGDPGCVSGPADHWREPEGPEFSPRRILLDGEPWRGELTRSEVARLPSVAEEAVRDARQSAEEDDADRDRDER